MYLRTDVPYSISCQVNDKSADLIPDASIRAKLAAGAAAERRSPKRGGGGGVPARSQQPHQSPPAGVMIDFPLRILVQSDMVGAIIGRGGQTIRQITQQTR